MAGFSVHILRLHYSRDGQIKYVMKLYRDGIDEPGTPLIRYSGEAALLEALNRLNVAESEQQRLFSELHDHSSGSFSVDISEDVARQFGWPPAA